MKNPIGFVAVLLTASALFSSCQKNADVSTTAAINEAISAFAEKAMVETVDRATLRSSSETCNPLDQLPDCVEVTDSGEGVYPRTLVLDFGDGCEDEQGRVRSGQIHIEMSGAMLTNGSIRTVTMSDFQVGEVSITGTRVTTSLGYTESGNPAFDRVVELDMVRNGNTMSREHATSVVWISGHETPECGDNVFEITGSGNCTRPNGAVVSRTILEALVLDHACGYIVQGVVVVDAPNGPREIDFGDGTCDSLASMTVDGETIEIDLNNFGCRKRH